MSAVLEQHGGRCRSTQTRTLYPGARTVGSGITERFEAFTMDWGQAPVLFVRPARNAYTSVARCDSLRTRPSSTEYAGLHSRKSDAHSERRDILRVLVLE